MARGAPDYLVSVGGKTPELYVTYSQIQVPVLMFDDFESTTIKWYFPFGTITRDTTSGNSSGQSPVMNGDACLKCVTGAGAFFNCFSINREISITEPATTLGISYWCYSPKFENFYASDGDSKFIRFDYYDGTNLTSLWITYNPSTGNWYYSNDYGSTFVLIGNHYLRNIVLHYLKLVVDLANVKAAYLSVDAVRYDLSDVALYQAADVSTSHLYVGVSGREGDASATMYIDDYKVTYNEPV